jgi:hypothetical protein
VITIPVIPGKARGKNIIVEVEFKPVHKIKLNKTSSGEQTGKAEVLQTTPPGAIPDGACYGIEGVFVCYWWELKTVHYRSRGIEFVPLSISYIDDIDGDYVERVSHLHIIRLGRTTVRTLSFDLSLAFGKVVNFIVPGPGYARTLPAGSSEETLFEMVCPVMNLKVTSRARDCLYFSKPVDLGYGRFPLKGIAPDALIAANTGLVNPIASVFFFSGHDLKGPGMGALRAPPGGGPSGSWTHLGHEVRPVRGFGSANGPEGPEGDTVHGEEG